MAKKEFYMIIDSESTNDDKVYDFAAVVCDRKGQVHKQMAVLVREHIHKELFNNGQGIWTKAYAKSKKENYDAMLKDGRRIVASVPAINKWMARAYAEYQPMLTAYNLVFDKGISQRTGIDLSLWQGHEFCLWHAAKEQWGSTRKYLSFIIEKGHLNNRTKHGNVTIKTNAEVMAEYIKGIEECEPHTALEDIIDFELPILIALVNKKGWKERLHIPYNWKSHLANDKFKPI